VVLALLATHHIFHISRIKVKGSFLKEKAVDEKELNFSGFHRGCCSKDSPLGSDVV
jgi:hypothetical protein